MARRRTLDRKALRENAEAAERLDGDRAEAAEEEADDDEEVDEDGEPVKKKPVKKAKAPAAKKPRTRTAKVVRMKVVWGVYDNGNRKIQEFPYNQRAQAEAFVAERSAEKKQTFFLQPDKIPLEDK